MNVTVKSFPLFVFFSRLFANVCDNNDYSCVVYVIAVIDEAKWTTLAPMMTARNGHIVLATDTAVYVLGGTSGEVKATNHCETYDPRTNVWTEVKRLFVVCVCVS
jgi:N-acetylneuraminic acid mutarotase